MEFTLRYGLCNKLRRVKNRSSLSEKKMFTMAARYTNKDVSTIIYKINKHVETRDSRVRGIRTKVKTFNETQMLWIHAGVGGANVSRFYVTE